ncbi:MAG: type II CAAX endopeptidase family protein [Prochlorococcaceae cyanobacterium ETNP1_MAG_9]|nr:type II CAAX endopeptidase family protein [Prochlorococcaceae cyanobacterium ETNP1_MAG_9]
MRQATSVGKVALASLSLFLALLIWGKGLQESFSRPSVVPKLSVRQQEIAWLATPAIPDTLKPFFLGDSSEIKLRDALRETPLDQMEDRERIVLAALETTDENRRLTLKMPFEVEAFVPVQEALLASTGGRNIEPSTFNVLKSIKNDPLLYQVVCLALGGDKDICVDSVISKTMAFRLIFSQGVPAVAILLGSVLLIRQAWLFLGNSNGDWPPLVSMPLSLVDMVLLVAGGFVVLGEVLFPALVAPFTESVTKQIGSPLREALRVFVGYSVMTLPPLLILREQLKGLKHFDLPVGGWLQWHLRPVAPALRQASVAWVMVMPLVLVTSWLMNSLVGDQGGSNPLLELVLRSQEPLSLTLLLLTTVVFAPLFEELVFRGALLPVLAQSYGRVLGVIVSALVFALAHLSVGEFPPLVVLGLGLGLLRLSSGRLFPCVLMHSLWNGVTFINLVLLG